MLSNIRRGKITCLLVLVCFLCQTVAGVMPATAAAFKKNIQVNLGQTVIVEAEGIIKRVSLGNPAISDYSVISKNEVMLLGAKSGSTELYIWLDNDDMLRYNLIVYDDLSELRTKLIQILGARAVQSIKLVLAKETVILKGIVKSQYEAHQAEEVAALYYKVMNLLEVKPEEAVATLVAKEDMTPDELARLAQEQQYKDALEKTSRIFRLQHAQAVDVKAMFDKMKSKDGYVEVDARTNSLVVIDKPAVVQHMSSILAVLDENEPQILIEAKVVEVTLGDDMRSAFDWIYETLYSGTNALGTSLNNKGVGVSSGQMTMQLDYGKITNDHFAAKILPQLTERHSRLVSSPTTVTLNRKKAKIEINDKIPYITFTPQGSTGILVPTPSTIDAGISLEVTPTLKNDNEVELDMKISVNSFIENVNFGTYGTVPRTFEKTSTNLVTIPSGNTLVIGGLIRDDVRTSTAKVPWLGNLPIIKNMFRNNENNVSRTELLIFVTPRLIHSTNEGIETDHFVDIQRDELKYEATQERRKARYEKELKQDFPLDLPLNPDVLKKQTSQMKDLPEVPSLSEQKKVTVPVQKSVAVQPSTIKTTPETARMAEPAKQVVAAPAVKARTPEEVMPAKAKAPQVAAVKKPRKSFKKSTPLRSKEAKEMLASLRQNMKDSTSENTATPVGLKTGILDKEIKPLTQQVSRKKKDRNRKKTEPVVVLEKVEVKEKPAGENKSEPVAVTPLKPVIKKHSIDLLSRERLEKLAEERFKDKISALNLTGKELSDRMSRKEMKSALAELKKEVSALPENGGAH